MAQPTTRTRTTERPAAETQQRPASVNRGSNLPAVAPTRLPWNPAIGQTYGAIGVTATTWRTIVEAIWPEAKTVEAVGMALSYCNARKLDPFKRPVHIVPVWNSSLGKMVETVWPGISELRTTAMRTGEYAGKDEVRFGPEIVVELGLEGQEKQFAVPEYAQVTVYRMVKGVRVPFAGDPVYWLESYAQRGGKQKDPAPNAMWSKRPYGQLAKVAEAIALRQAFPEEMGGTYTAEEMEGQTIGHEPVEHAPGPRGEREPRRKMDLQTGEVIDQTNPDVKDGVDEQPAEDANQAKEAEYEEAAEGDTASEAGDPEQYAKDLELVSSIEETLKGELPMDRHLVMVDCIEDLQQIAADEGVPPKLRARAEALAKIHDADKAKAEAQAEAKKTRGAK